MKIFLRPDIAKFWQQYVDPFVAANEQQGTIFRQLEGRRTLSFSYSGCNYFLKLHRGIGWAEIFKNLLSFRLPVIGAENERRAIELLKAKDVPTMTVAAFGKRGWNPAKQISFIVTDEIVYELTLEDLAKEWAKQPPEFKAKKRMIEKVAMLAAKMHAAGLNHRDFYLCHFLLEKRGSENLSIIDLHRAQIRSAVPYRWLVKDLAGLYFSSLDAGLSQTDFLRFIKVYSKVKDDQQSLKTIFQDNQKLWLDVKQKGLALYAKEQAKRSK